MQLTPRRIVMMLHDTLEAFLEPGDIAQNYVAFGSVQQGENENTLMREIDIDGSKYLVVIKRVGG